MHGRPRNCTEAVTHAGLPIDGGSAHESVGRGLVPMSLHSSCLPLCCRTVCYWLDIIYVDSRSTYNFNQLIECSENSSEETRVNEAILTRIL